MIIKSLNEGFESISSTVKPEMDDSFEKMIDEALDELPKEELEEAKTARPVNLDTMLSAINKAFNDGRYGKSGNWECGLGGYDTGYEVSYKNIPLFDIQGDDIKFLLDKYYMKRHFGITNEDIMDYLGEIGSFNALQDEELEEGCDKKLEEELTPFIDRDVEKAMLDDFMNDYIWDNIVFQDDEFDYEAIEANKREIYDYWNYLVNEVGEDDFEAAEIAVRQCCDMNESANELSSFDDFVNEAFHVNDEYDETPEDEPTRVFFVKEMNPYTEEEEEEVLAVFPDIVETTEGFVRCYAHMGQHSYCDLDYVKTLEAATEEEYASLLRELEQVAGYDNLIIVNKPTEELDEGSSLEDLHYQARHPKAPTTMPNGDPNRNPKIEIVVDGEYVATTRWYKTCKAAKEAYCKEHDVEPERVKCYRVK